MTWNGFSKRSIPQYKLGKLPATKDCRDLKFSTYADIRKIELPKDFGHELLIPSWDMFANDRVGCCVLAGAGHEHRIWGIEGEQKIFFTEYAILKAYSDITGYNPNIPSSDRGTNCRDAMKYRQTVGLIDSLGNTRKIRAYVRLEEGNIDEIKTALYLFGAVGAGIILPESAMIQLSKNQVWDKTLLHRSSLGGHYIPIVAFRNNMLICVTWGRLQAMTLGFYEKYCEEAWLMLCTDMFGCDGVTHEGWDMQQLEKDLMALAA